MTDPYDSLILRFIIRIFIVPFIFLFALYIIIHGEESAGGGFQGGAIMASAVVLVHLALGRTQAHRRFPVAAFRNAGVLGVGIFVATGLIGLFTGNNFLDYSALPIPGVEGSDLRGLGVFIVEVSIALGVVGALIVAFEFLSQNQVDDG
jgi:multicomponent Na+:H+ antiporter subunit B